jgi:hypothetical protein
VYRRTESKKAESKKTAQRNAGEEPCSYTRFRLNSLEWEVADTRPWVAALSRGCLSKPYGARPPTNGRSAPHRSRSSAAHWSTSTATHSVNRTAGRSRSGPRADSLVHVPQTRNGHSPLRDLNEAAGAAAENHPSNSQQRRVVPLGWNNRCIARRLF